MNIRTLFETEEELAKRFGERFMRMFCRLMERYAHKKRPMYSRALKAAALAFVFYGAAEAGNVELMRNFDSMIQGVAQEHLFLDDQMVYMQDELDVSLVWDIAALMLETSEGMPQEAFDMVGKHVWLAYEQEVTTDGQSESVQKKVVAVEAKKVNANIPSIPDDVTDWMINNAKESRDPQMALYTEMIITQNTMQRYHSDKFKKLQEMKKACQATPVFTGDIGQLTANADVNFEDEASIENLIKNNGTVNL